MSKRNERLKEKFRNKEYADAYICARTRSLIASGIRELRGDMTQAEFGERVGMSQNVISRLENEYYVGTSVRTLLKIANKMDVALICRFVDRDTFISASE